jgi:hypothetical protein
MKANNIAIILGIVGFMCVCNENQNTWVNYIGIILLVTTLIIANRHKIAAWLRT